MSATVYYRREGKRFSVYLDGRRAGPATTKKGARRLVVALADGRIRRVAGGVLLQCIPPPYVIDLNDHDKGEHWLAPFRSRHRGPTNKAGDVVRERE